MHTRYKTMAVLIEALAICAIFVGPALADDTDIKQRCEAMARRFKAADVSHLTADKLEAARRQANHGERLCNSSPQIGLKAIDLALRDIGDTAI